MVKKNVVIYTMGLFLGSGKEHSSYSSDRKYFTDRKLFTLYTFCLMIMAMTMILRILHYITHALTSLGYYRLVQKKAVRIITQSHYLAHTDPPFSELKPPKIR